MIDAEKTANTKSHYYMKYLRFVVFALFLVALLHYYTVLTGPCAQPIHYQVKSIDPQFGISTKEFTADVDSAAEIWNKALGKQLFVYDPKGSLTITLAYDTRQETTDRNKVLISNIDGTTKVAESTKSEYLALTDEYEKTRVEYAALLSAYNTKQGAYETEVAYWNKRGGASEPEYQKLLSEKAALTVERTALEAKRQALNALATKINSFIDTYNLLVNKINANITTVNSTAGKQIEEGVYDPNNTSITIYEYDNKTKLVRVLAHELGHALGLDHNADPLSIMYKLNQADNLTLSMADLQALKAVCKVQ